MRYKNLDIEFERIFTIGEHEMEQHKDCIVLDVFSEIHPTTISADVGCTGGMVMSGQQASMMTFTKFLVGRTKAGAALYEQNNRN